jgi:predicted ATP-grasp superfamily ATP-dependent carboligase
MEEITKHQALIIDQHTTYSPPLIRQLACAGYLVDIFTEQGAPSLNSRFCRKRHLAPSFTDGSSFINSIEKVVANECYDVIYLCSEEVLPFISQVTQKSDRWKALPLSDPADLNVMLSKSAVLKRVAEAGVPIPQTIFTCDEADIFHVGRQLGYPLLIKGDKGEGSQQVRLVSAPDHLLEEYRNVSSIDHTTQAPPVIQKYLRGPKYTIAGLFDRGKPLRVLAYLSELIYPPTIGPTIKGTTANPPNLLDVAFKAFDALKFTGLGNVECILDCRDNRFKFLEINPRVWGNVGFAQYAGVDLYTPYYNLAKGLPVLPDLNFKTGIRYRRWLNDLRLVARRPGRILGFFSDCIDPRVHSDFDWNDLSASFPIKYIVKKYFG